jgi:four helix bundle protein
MEMTAEQEIAKTGAAEAPGASNPIQIAEHLADNLWRITQTWNDFAKTTVAVPLTRAMNEIGLQLRLTLGRTPIKQHLQHIENARRALIPVEYYLQCAHRRGLIETGQAEQLQSQMINLAQRLDRHRVAIVQAANQKIAVQKQRQEKKTQNAQAENNPIVITGSNIAH